MSDTQDTKAFTLRVPKNLHRRMRIVAASDDKTLTAWIVTMLEMATTAGEKRQT